MPLYVLPDGTYFLPTGHTVAPNSIIGSGILLSDGILLGGGILLSDGLRESVAFADEAAWGSNPVEPGSMRLKQEQVLHQGESALPTSVSRLSTSSPLYPKRE